VCGLDYRYAIQERVYKQMIYQMLHQSHLRGMRALHLGMDADIEKNRYRTSIIKNCVYLQARESYNATLLREIVAEVGLEGEHDVRAGVAYGLPSSPPGPPESSEAHVRTP
jgi:hypothetical protein